MSETLLERLEKVESSQDDGFDPARATTNWYRNPDGPEAAARIRALEAENAKMLLSIETLESERKRPGVRLVHLQRAVAVVAASVTARATLSEKDRTP